MLEGGNEAVGDIFLVYKKLRFKKKKKKAIKKVTNILNHIFSLKFNFLRSLVEIYVFHSQIQKYF